MEPRKALRIISDWLERKPVDSVVVKSSQQNGDTKAPRPKPGRECR